MSKWYGKDDGNWSLLKDQTITVFGYGNQGRSQALNLRDTGLKLRISNREDSYADIARSDGFEVVPLDQGAAESDVVWILLPDEVIPSVFARDIRANLRPGCMVGFACGFAVAFDLVDMPDTVDVAMVAPRMLGEGVRRNYLKSIGFPSLIAVERDASGEALARTLAFADGIGSLATGALESSFLEEATVDLFAEHMPGLYDLRCQFDALTTAGFNPEAVLLELYASGELIANSQAVHDYGLWGQLKIHSPASQYGQEIIARRLVDENETKRTYAEVIDHIVSGNFAKEWVAEYDSGAEAWHCVRRENMNAPIIRAERDLYRQLGRADWDDGTLSLG